jgi:hypothetical protein
MSKAIEKDTYFYESNGPQFQEHAIASAPLFPVNRLEPSKQFLVAFDLSSARVLSVNLYDFETCYTSYINAYMEKALSVRLHRLSAQ